MANKYHWSEQKWPRNNWSREEICAQYGEGWAHLVDIVRDSQYHLDALKIVIKKTPLRYRAAYALALSLAKWLPGVMQDRKTWYTCGACIHWNLLDYDGCGCPLSSSEKDAYCEVICLYSQKGEKRTPANVLNRIIDAYLKERKKALAS